jgi:hypothetical protein
MKTTIEMAFEAKLICALDDPTAFWPESHDMTNELKAFEALVRADEREACAEVCDELHWPWRMGDNSGPKECATAIRARGNT